MHQPTESTPSLSALVLAPTESALVSKTILKSNGFEVKEARDASSASELCRHRRFDLGVYDDCVHGAMELAGNTRCSSLPRVSIGLLKNATGAFPRLHFILPKPLRTEVFSRTIKAAGSHCCGSEAEFPASGPYRCCVLRIAAWRQSARPVGRSCGEPQPDWLMSSGGRDASAVRER